MSKLEHEVQGHLQATRKIADNGVSASYELAEYLWTISHKDNESLVRRLASSGKNFHDVFDCETLRCCAISCHKLIRTFDRCPKREEWMSKGVGVLVVQVDSEIQLEIKKRKLKNKPKPKPIPPPDPLPPPNSGTIGTHSSKISEPANEPVITPTQPPQGQFESMQDQIIRLKAELKAANDRANKEESRANKEESRANKAEAQVLKAQRLFARYRKEIMPPKFHDDMSKILYPNESGNGAVNLHYSRKRKSKRLVAAR
jgi:hypothetical protein